MSQEVPPASHHRGGRGGGGGGHRRNHHHQDRQLYRPGAFNPNGWRPLPEEERGEGEGERRRQSRFAPPRAHEATEGDGDGDCDDLRNKLNGMRVSSNNPVDLRQRLNRRSAAPEAPPSVQTPAADGDGHRPPRNANRGGRNHHSRLQGRGGGFVAGTNLPKPKRNTENFNPSHAPAEMRLLAARPGLSAYDREITSRDVIVVNDLFGDPDDMSTYEALLDELKNSGVAESQLWQLWHGDSHVIADDKRKWKENCPTFARVVKKLEDYFNMDVKATRLNWYRDSKEWKPFHHDAAAVKDDKAKTQNFTVAVSFGMERDAAFEHAKTKTVISMPQPNGTIYTFGKDVNILWRHGILQLPPEKYSTDGRISIIAWGWVNQTQIEA